MSGKPRRTTRLAARVAITLSSNFTADDLGGKAYCLFTGTVADVEAAVEGAVATTQDSDHMVGSTVITQLPPDMRANLAAEWRFNHHLRSGAS